MTNNLTMQELLEQQEQEFNQVKAGQTITGKISKITNDEVVDAIKNIDKIKEQYKDRYEEFYNRFCCVDDGHAAQRVVEKVFK